MGSGGFNAAIDQRFPVTTGIVINNLYTTAISTRNGGQAELLNNVQGTIALWESPDTCGLHLVAEAENIDSVLDRGNTTNITTDIDGNVRDANPDIGADELNHHGGDSGSNPQAPSNLRITH